MRQSGRQLGAITAKARLEYFIPSSIADSIGGKGNYAYCIDAEALLEIIDNRRLIASHKLSRTVDERSRIENLRNYGYDESVITREAKKREALAKRQAKAGDALAQFEKLVEDEVWELRQKRRVSGPIPVCINRSSGKRGSELPRDQRRANATHERFHADARRFEFDNGVEKFECYKRLDELTKPYIGNTNLRYHSLVHFAQMKSKLATEELLARVEEVRKACETKKGKKQGDCGPTLRSITNQMRQADGDAFVELVRGVKEDYGTPLNVVRAAVRSCKVP